MRLEGIDGIRVELFTIHDAECKKSHSLLFMISYNSLIPPTHIVDD